MLLSNLIIAGSPKCGTTSLFRYLADHPEVCSSSAKEIRFFFRFRDRIDERALRVYASYFAHCDNSISVRLESSPGYLAGGAEVASKIKKHLLDAKLVFMMREPVSRLYSFFWAQQSKTGKISAALSFEEYVDLALGGGETSKVNPDPTVAQRMLSRVNEGCYAGFLKEYFRYFTRDQMSVNFIDMLAKDPKKLVGDVCVFAGIDRHFYDEYVFTVENKTRGVKFKGIHKFISKVNRRFETSLNRWPRVRGGVRSLYGFVNPEPGKGSHRPALLDATRGRLNDFYKEHNRELQVLLRSEYPDLETPRWLEKYK